MEAADGKETRTLVIFPGALGDLICWLPALRVIAARHPASRLELMARFELARFAVGRTPVARAHSIDRAEVAQLFSPPDEVPASAREFFGAFRRIYSFFAADHPQFPITLGAVAREVHCYPFRPPTAGHVAAAYLRALDAPAASILDARLAILPADHAAALAHLDRSGLAPRTYVLLLPGSGSRAKNWPVANFVALAGRGAPRRPILAVLGPAEAELAPAFRAANIPVLDGLALGEVAALAAHARVFVGNDSGVAHLAAAAGASGVVLFGPTDPARWRPLGEVRIVRGEVMAKITVAEVAAALDDCQS